MTQLQTHSPLRLSNRVELVGSCDLPTKWGSFRLFGFFEAATQKEHIALVFGNVKENSPVLTRIHSECLTGDAFFSKRCDCGAQLDESLRQISLSGAGVLIYLRQEGRGIGLLNKIRAYQLQDQGADTVIANEALGLPVDARRYDLCGPILEELGVSVVRLLTNNPAKINALKTLGIQVVSREPLLVGGTPENLSYLETKHKKFGHWLFEGEHSNVPSHFDL